MKKCIALFITAFLALNNASAAKPAVIAEKISPVRKQLAEALLEKLELKKKILESFVQIEQLQKKIIDKILENAPDTLEVKQLRAKITKLTKAELSWDKAKKELVPVYARAYTENELKELSSFFDSPAGKKFIASTPKLQRQLITVIQKQIKNATFKSRMLAIDFMKKQMLAGKTKMPAALKPGAKAAPRTRSAK